MKRKVERLYRFFTVSKEGVVFELLWEGERERSVEEYRLMVKRYDEMDKINRAIFEQGVDELFTDEEVVFLKDKVKKHYGWHVNVIEVSLPVLRVPYLLRKKIVPNFFVYFDMGINLPIVGFSAINVFYDKLNSIKGLRYVN